MLVNLRQQSFNKTWYYKAINFTCDVQNTIQSHHVTQTKQKNTTE